MLKLLFHVADLACVPLKGQAHLLQSPKKNTFLPSQTYFPHLWSYAGVCKQAVLFIRLFTVGPIQIPLVALRRILAAGMAHGYMVKPRFQLLRRTKHFLAFFHHELHGFICHVVLPARHFLNSSIWFVSHEQQSKELSFIFKRWQRLSRLLPLFDK